MKKILLSSIVSIVLCAVLIAGSTFALFTSDDQYNVAATSATVKVTATIKDNAITLGSTLGTNVPETTVTNAVVNDVNTITLDKIVPGDYVEFTLVITNESNVSVNYRTTFSTVADNGLLAGLVVTVGGEAYTGEAIATDWAALDVATIEVPVRISLPEAAGNEYQDKTLTLSYLVEAVQGNARP